VLSRHQTEGILNPAPVLQCIAVCYSVAQHVTVCCSVLQCVAVCYSALQRVAACCSVFQFQETLTQVISLAE